MLLEDWKKAYHGLDPVARKELARWILDQELGSGPGAVTAARRGLVIPVRAAAVFGVILVSGLAGWQGVVWKKGRDADRARMTAVEREAEEARRPRSPKNLEFLRKQLGREVTVTGIPELSEVGFLYFSKDRGRSLRLNLMPGGVVLLQSAELEEWVLKKTELTVTGILEKAEDGALEIKVHSPGQMRRRAN